MLIDITFKGGVVGIPYATFHEAGDRHEFVDLRAFPDAIKDLPEPQRWPELREFLVQLNQPAGAFLTLGCECADATGTTFPGGMTHKVASYVHVALSNLPLAQSEDAYFVLLGRFFKYAKDRSKAEPLIVEFEVDRFGFVDQKVEGWCLAVWVCGFGMDDASARAIWAEGLKFILDFFVQQNDSPTWRLTPVASGSKPSG
jgi:hypothetical protein